MLAVDLIVDSAREIMSQKLADSLRLCAVKLYFSLCDDCSRYRIAATPVRIVVYVGSDLKLFLARRRVKSAAHHSPET